MKSVGEVCWCRSLDSLEIVDTIRVLLQELWSWLNYLNIWKEQFLIRNDKKTIVLYQQDEEILCVVLIKKDTLVSPKRINKNFVQHYIYIFKVNL